MKLVVVVGAGFNADAGPEVGTIHRESIYGPYEFREAYPLVGDLTSLCFPDGLPAGATSIEDALARTIAEKRWDPVRRLCSRLRRADHYLAFSLLPSNGQVKSRYARFFDRFQEAEFISFNYDSLVEAFLYASGRWHPQDGYGPSVLALPSYKAGRDFPSPGPSTSHAFHLHGSLNVSESRWDATPPDTAGIRWLREKPQLEFMFDPGSNAALFFPWTRFHRPVNGFDPVEARIIAPVPSKAPALARAFVASTREMAAGVLSAAEQVVSIGYDFNPLDRESYDPLLEAVTAPILLVCPNADALRDRLKGSHPNVTWVARQATFAEWADDDFA